jgi:hypothetical protein
MQRNNPLFRAKFHGFDLFRVFGFIFAADIIFFAAGAAAQGYLDSHVVHILP